MIMTIFQIKQEVLKTHRIEFVAPRLSHKANITNINHLQISQNKYNKYNIGLPFIIKIQNKN